MWGTRKKSLSISHTHAGRKSTIRNNCQLFFSPPQILFTKSIFGKLNRAIIEVNLRSFDALLQLQNLSAVPSPRCFAYSQFRNLKRTLAGNLKGNMLSDDCAVWPSDRFVILIFAVAKKTRCFLPEGLNAIGARVLKSEYRVLWILDACVSRNPFCSGRAVRERLRSRFFLKSKRVKESDKKTKGGKWFLPGCNPFRVEFFELWRGCFLFAFYIRTHLPVYPFSFFRRL